MADLYSAPTDKFNKTSLPPPEEVPLLGVDNYDAGLITDADPARIPLNALSILQNAGYIKSQLIRRNGLSSYIGIAQSGKVLNIYAFISDAGGLAIFSFFKDKIYKVSNSGWIETTPNAIAAISGGDFDFFNFAVGDDRMFFTNGVDPIREVDPVLNQYKALGNAPSYKYVTTAFNRIIGANNITDATPAEIGWSGFRNYDEWDPLVDNSAGSTPIVDSPSDTSDGITGLFYLGTGICVCRERSMWIGVSRPAATNPFNFTVSLPEIGADIPRAIQLTPYGLVWYNFQDGAVYVWNPGSDYKDIAGPVRRGIRASIYTTDQIWSAYSADLRVYSLFIGSSITNVVTEWQYNFLTNNWCTNTYENVSTVNDLKFSSTTFTIGQLTGDIGDLVGPIGSLGGIVATATRFFGFTDGNVKTQAFFDEDAAEANGLSLTDDGTAFTTIIAHKIIEQPLEYLISNIVRASVTPWTVGSVNIEYSKDDGQTWTIAKTVTFAAGDRFKQNVIQLKRAIRFRRIQWRIVTSDCVITANRFDVRALEAGISK